MAWQRKSLSEHVAIVTGWFDGLISGGSAILRNSMLSVFARVIAFVVAGFEGFLEAAEKNLHVRTMDRDHLLQRAADYNILPIAATYALGYATVTGNIGTMISEGELIQRSDGVQFAVDADVTMLSTSQLVPVAAVEPGINGNTIPFLEMNFVSPIFGINSTITIDENGITGGADDEDTESLRARILAWQANRPRGGANHDYVSWVKQIYADVRVWVFGDYAGKGTVGVAFVFNDRDIIFPTAAEVAKVQTYLISQAPVTQKTRTTAFAPTPKAINISLEITPDTPTNRTAVETAIADYFKAEGTCGGTVLLSKIETIIITTDGITDRTVLLPSGNITLAANEYPVPGAYNWN